MDNISTDNIRVQAEKILASDDFLASDRISQFLRYVIDKTLNGQQAEIKQYTVAVEGLGYDEDFDPNSNPIIRIQAGKLRRALEHYFATDGNKDSIRISIPKGTYVPEFNINSAKNQNEVSVSGHPYFSPTMKDPQAAVWDSPSIAILPYEYLGNGSDYEYIASGITEEIIIALKRFQEFLVIGPLNREIIRQKHLDARGICQEYKVRFLLDGTIRQRGQNLRLTTNLTDAHTGQKLWGQAHDYDTDAAIIEKLENEIVSQIVASIADNFGVIPRTLTSKTLSRPNDNLSDYEAVLKFHHHNSTLTEESLSDALEALETCVQRNPNNDLTLAILADVLANIFFLGYVDHSSAIKRSERLAKKALALNPNSQQAHFAMAQIHYLRFDRQQCLIAIEKVLEINPNNANYLAASAVYLIGLGQWGNANILIQKAIRLNPHHPGWYHFVPYLYHYSRNEFHTAFTDAINFNTPDYFWDPLIQAAALGQLGRQVEAGNAIDELLALVPDFEIRGRSLIQRVVFSDELTKMLLEGLHKAGL